MALISEINRLELQINKVHDKADCTYSTFTATDGKKYLQIDTYGSAARKIKGKKSQTIQMNEDTARKLMDFLRSEFG